MSRIAAAFPVALLLALAATAACDNVERINQDPARELWATAGDGIKTRSAELRAREQALAARIAALKVPAGVEDPGLADAITTLTSQVDGLDQACAAVEQALSQVTSDVEFALSKPNKIVAKQAVDTGLATFDGAATQAKRALDAITPQVATAEALMQKQLDGVAADVKRLDNLAASGGSVDFSDIDFKTGTAELDLSHPASKATLDRLTAFAGNCDQLRFTLTGHTSAEGSPSANKALSLARADAVKGYLTTAGVAAVKIAATAGLGSAKPIIDEPVPGTPEEAAMPPAELEARRHKNRRITVEVTTPCTVPVDQPPDTAPRPAGDAIPPGAPRGTVPPAVEQGGAPQPVNPSRPVRATAPAAHAHLDPAAGTPPTGGGH